MLMSHANIETLTAAATYVATGASCREEPSGFSLLDDDQALARRCYR